jgi:hypothetical protein
VVTAVVRFMLLLLLLLLLLLIHRGLETDKVNDNVKNSQIHRVITAN